MASFTHQQLEQLWITAGGSAATADTAAAIAEAESGGCQYAKHGPTDDRPVKQCTYTFSLGENSYGLWQINRQAHPTYSASSLYAAVGNANAAARIANFGRDFGPWTTYVNGAYKQYLQTGGEPTPQAGTTAPPTFEAVATTSHRGYADLRNSLGRHLPLNLERSRKTGLATLQTLSRARRVKG